MTEVRHGVRGAVAVCGPETVQTVGSMTRDIAADSVQIGPLGPVSIHATIICTEVWFSRPTAQCTLLVLIDFCPVYSDFSTWSLFIKTFEVKIYFNQK